MDAGRMAVLTDPEGAAFLRVGEAKEHRGANVYAHADPGHRA